MKTTCSPRSPPIDFQNAKNSPEPPSPRTSKKKLGSKPTNLIRNENIQFTATTCNSQLLLPKNGIRSSCIDGLCTSCSQTLSFKSLPFKFRCTSRVRRFLPVALFPRIWMLSVFLSPHLRIFDFWTLVGPYKFPCTSLTTLSFIDVPRIDRILKSCGRFSLALNGLCDTRLMGLAFARIIGFGFAIDEPSLEVVCWPLLDMALCFPIGSERKLLKWLQENIEKLMMFNKRRRWSHSSRMKLSLVSMSASWFLVSTYLIWIFIRSNNQSSATLWVLDTCLIVGLTCLVGLRPLMIILMAASLSSKMYSWDSPWGECVLVCT